MRSELSFLMELFLNEEVPVPIKKLVADRIREVEEKLSKPQVSQVVGVPCVPGVPPRPMLPEGESSVGQAPSMQRIMAENPDLVPKGPIPVTPAAAAALQRRNEVMARAMNQKTEHGRSSPAKM